MENQTPSSLEVVEAFDEFMHSFESFKQANDERLAQLENRVSEDVVTTDKVNRINAALDEQKRALDRMVLGGRRPQLSGKSYANNTEAKSAFEAYVRSGDARRLRGLEEKSLSAGSGPDGGYLVPQQTEVEIGRRLAAISPIRAIASVRQVSNASYKKPFSTTGASVGWVGETASRPETAGPTLAEMSFPTMELYAMPAATQTLLDDAAINLDDWLADEVQTAFAEQEGAAFVNGNGTTQPKGFMSYNKVADSAWSWDNLGYLATGVDGGFSATDPADDLVDLIYAVKAGYRQNGSFVMNRKTQSAVRKLKDADGNYIWQPSLTPENRATLMGFPLVEAEDMPDIGSDSYSIAFGDFNRGYLVVDRLGVRILRDPYSAKPYVLFYTTKRVGGGVQDFNAIKLMKFGTA